MYCNRCGVLMEEGAEFCLNCGQPASASASTGAAAATLPATETAPVTVTYAGFWLRLVAFLIDSLILSAAILILMVPLVPLVFRGRGRFGPEEAAPVLIVFAISIGLLSLLGKWLYYALFESSAWQATPGKRVIGLYVTDLQGRRISFARATGRYFGKILSAIILYIGFVMAGFTEKKQALHDLLVDCLVLRRL
jgi:uncharacterized RDD family membrane protein YckC